MVLLYTYCFYKTGSNVLSKVNPQLSSIIHCPYLIVEIVISIISGFDNLMHLNEAFLLKLPYFFKNILA